MSRQATGKKNREPEIITYWSGSWATRPLGYCVLAWCASALLWRLTVPLWAVIIGSLIAAILAPMVATGLDQPPRASWFHFALWVVLGSYASWLVGTTPLQRDAFLVPIPAAGLLGSWWWWLRHLNARDQARGSDKHRQAEADAARGEYVAIIERVLKKKPDTSGIKEVSRTPFEAGREYGETIELELPADGSVTYTLLEGMVEKLVTAADARKGALVFEEDPDRGRRVKLHVSHRDALMETRPLPFDRGPKSIHDPISLGQYADGGIAVVTFREVAAQLVGIRGSGKSSLINTHLAHLTGCVDALVWMIDLKNGETARPWVEPFLQATTGRPALDWLAVDHAESDAILAAIKAAIRSRKGPVKPSRDKPAIILIVEEASLVTGVGKVENVDRAGQLQDGVTTGRSVAVDALICSQRGTVTMLGNGDMTSNLDLRYGMRVQDRQEASMVFADGDWASLLTTIRKENSHRGVFLAQGSETFRKMLAKSFWVDPDLIPSMAVSNAEYRAELDFDTRLAVEAALIAYGVSGGYEGRWDRLTKALGVTARETAGASHGASHQVSHAAPAAVSHETPEARGERLVNEAIAASQAEREAARTETEFATITGSEWDEEAGVWRETETPVDIPPEERADPDVIPPILRHLVRIFAARKADKLPTRVILEDLPGDMSPKAFGLLANHCGFTSIENVRDGEARARGYAWADVNRAVAKARMGQMPREAFDWQP